MTHTYAILDVSPTSFQEIKHKLAKAGYAYAFHDDLIDLHGLALRTQDTKGSSANLEIGTLLSHRTREGRVEIVLNGEKTQMDLDKAREVLGMLASAIEAAVSDQLIFAFLTTRIGLDENKAAAALMDFRELRQGSRDVVHPH